VIVATRLLRRTWLTLLAFVAGGVFGMVALGYLQAVQEPMIIGDGIWRVGTDMAAGTWTLTRPVTSECGWVRLSDLSGQPEAIIAGTVLPGPQTVTVAPTDVAFKTVGGCQWQKIG
jgi:hypothetical protein